jgi:hypothetical protein
LIRDDDEVAGLAAGDREPARQGQDDRHGVAEGLTAAASGTLPDGGGPRPGLTGHGVPPRDLVVRHTFAENPTWVPAVVPQTEVAAVTDHFPSLGASSYDLTEERRERRA